MVAVFFLPPLAALHAPSQLSPWGLTCRDGISRVSCPMASRLGQWGLLVEGWGMGESGRGHLPSRCPAGLLQAGSPLKIWLLQGILCTQPSLSLASGSCTFHPSPGGSPLRLVIFLCSAQIFVKSPFIKLFSNCQNLTVPSVSCWEADW